MRVVHFRRKIGRKKNENSISRHCVIKFEINPVLVSPRIFHFLIVSDRRENFSQSESAIGLSPPTEKAHHLLQAWHRRGRTPILPLAQGRVRYAGTPQNLRPLLLRGHASCRSNFFGQFTGIRFRTPTFSSIFKGIKKIIIWDCFF